MLKAVKQGRIVRAPAWRAVSLGVFLASVLTGCTGMAVSTSRPVSLVQGPPITDIFTPFDLALSCLNGQLRPDVSFSVGAILDQTGKDAITNGGSGKYISQGAGDMVQSALFRSGVTLLNRRDPRIMETEVKWGVRNPKTIAASNYFITGSVNSLDFIPGGGMDVQVAGVGPQYSQTRIIVGLDLSLTDANTSRVVANVSLQKQIAAQDYGINAGRFAGITLLNVQVGAGEREATNFALRQMLNLATFELLTQVMDPSSYVQCRERIPPEYGTLNLTRSSVRLSMYKKKQEALAANRQKPAQQELADPNEPIVVVEQSEAPRPVRKSVASAPAPAPEPAPVKPADEPVKPAPVPEQAVTEPVKPVPVVVVPPKPIPVATVKPQPAPAPAPAPVPAPAPAKAPPAEQAVVEPAKPVPVATVPPKPTPVATVTSPQSKPAAAPVAVNTVAEKPVVEKPVAVNSVAEKPVAVKPAAVVKPAAAPIEPAAPAAAPKSAPTPVVADDTPATPPAKPVVGAREKVAVAPAAPVAAPSKVTAAVAQPTRASVVQAKPALSPAPEIYADETPTLVKPSVQVKPKPVEMAPLTPVAKPVQVKPAQSPLPEPVAKVTPEAKPSLKPQTKPSLLDGEWSSASADEKASLSPAKPGSTPASVSREKMAAVAPAVTRGTTKQVSAPASASAPVVAQAAPATVKPAAAPAKPVVAKVVAAKPVKPVKPAAEVVPSYVQTTSKSNTVAFVSSDDDGGKYWSEESVEDSRLSPLR